ncbi:MAG TPA: maleylacetate reductase [Gammaproteobacteria bacterium]|nr:maleylacetate reductase [Gammaproteobacteria bacterium]
MEPFVYQAVPMRIVFGHGSAAQLGDETDGLGLTRILVLSTPGRRGLAEELSAGLGRRVVGIHARARMHVPAVTVDAAQQAALQARADGLLAVGGGSTTGLAKGVALVTGLPIVAVPTTYSGSEATPIWGITDNGAKRTGRDQRVLPRTVVYDPDLSRALPLDIAGPSAVNALAHCVEALYAGDANPITLLMAEEGIRALAGALEGMAHNAGDPEPRARALYGAWLAGTSLAAVRMSLHHKLCHVLGGSFDLPHSEVHTVILPYALAYNAAAAPEAYARIQSALGSEDASRRIQSLAGAVGAPRSLDELGMRGEDLDRAAALAAQDSYGNPAPVTQAGVKRLLERAFTGEEPVC